MHLDICGARGRWKIQTDLLRHVLVSSIRRQRDWRVWLEGAGVRVARIPSGSTFANSALAYQVAIDGMGVAMAQKELVRDDMTGGRLVPAYPLYVPNGEIYYLASMEMSVFRGGESVSAVDSIVQQFAGVAADGNLMRRRRLGMVLATGCHDVCMT